MLWPWQILTGGSLVSSNVKNAKIKIAQGAAAAFFQCTMALQFYFASKKRCNLCFP